MLFYPSDHGRNSGVLCCSLVCSVFLLPHLLVVVFYYPMLLYSSCKIYSGRCCSLLSWEKLYPCYIPATCFTVPSSPTETDQSAVLGNVVLHFSRSGVWGYACSSGDNTGEVYNWELLWEPWLSSSAMERRILLPYGAASWSWVLRGIQLQWTSASVLCVGGKLFGFV